MERPNTPTPDNMVEIKRARHSSMQSYVDSPARENNTERPNTPSPDSMAEIKRARHISMQSYVDSIARNSCSCGGDDAASRRLSMRSMPIGGMAYNNNSNRNSGMSHLLGHENNRHSMLSYLSNQEFEGYGRNSNSNSNSNGVPESITEEPPPPEPLIPIEMSSVREILFVAICAVSHLMTQAALGQALAPIDIIATSFGNVTPGQQTWFIAAYSLTVGTFIMISGRVGDIFGHRRVFAFGYAWLGVWSGFSGFSAYTRSQIFFDLCRAMQGIGPALLMPNALALLGRAYPPGMRKNIVFSIFGALAPAGFVVGATSGSLFAELVWWPWAFWSYGMASLVLGGIALLVIPKHLSKKPQIRPAFDWAGSFVIVTGLVLINIAFNNGPLFGWNAPHVYFVLIMGLMCFGAFIFVEDRAVNPLLPIRAMNSTVLYVLALVGLGWGSFGVWVFYTVRFLLTIRGKSPLQVSAQFSPVVVAGLIAAGITGFMLSRLPVSFVMMVSMAAFFIGTIITSFQPAQQVYWGQTFISMLIMPFGMDMSFPAATVILSNHMPPEHQGLAASLVNTIVNYSISIALGVAGTVEVYAQSDSALQQNRNALYTAIGLSGTGVLLGSMFFAQCMRKEGWVVKGR